MTYVPDWMPQPPLHEAIVLAQRVGFASVVIGGEQGPMAAHVPIYVDTEGDRLELRFHLAVNNPLVGRLAEGTPTLLIFRGPDGYISPSWYDHENVPTWDYAFVHMSGTPRLLERDVLESHVLELVERFDPELEMSGAYVERYLGDVRGFGIASPEVQSVVKLSQDKSAESIDGVVAGLCQRGGDGDAQLADAIERARTLKNRHRPSTDMLPDDVPHDQRTSGYEMPREDA